MDKESIRDNGKRLLKEQMLVRAAETAVKYKITKEEMIEFVENVEEKLYELYNDVGFKYKAKFRSLLFNIKDRKNLYLWEQICEKKISPHELVRLTPKELASRELTKWRDKEIKRQLELVKKRELELLAANKTYVLKTHKGDRVMKNETATKVELDPDVPVDKIVLVLNDINKGKINLRAKKRKNLEEDPTSDSKMKYAKDKTNNDLCDTEKQLSKAISKQTKDRKTEIRPKARFDINNKQKNTTKAKQKILQTKHKNISKKDSYVKDINEIKHVKLYEVDMFSETSVNNDHQSANETIENKHKSDIITLPTEKSEQVDNNSILGSNRKIPKQTKIDQINTNLSSVDNKTSKVNAKKWFDKSLKDKKKEVAKILNRVNNVLIKEKRIKGDDKKEKCKPDLKNDNVKTATSVSQKKLPPKGVNKKARNKISQDVSERKLRLIFRDIALSITQRELS